MGIGAFITCLATSDSTITLGNGMLIVSIIMMGFGYSKWQPWGYRTKSVAVNADGTS